MPVKLHRITIVGAGHYGLMIAPKYSKTPNIFIVGIIEINPNKEKILSGPLKDVPIFCSPDEWKKKFGNPKSNDIFDLCIHENDLISEIEKLIKIGAKNIILPKPIALTEDRLKKIKHIIKTNKLNVVVASQWQSASITEKLKYFYKKLKNSGKTIRKIEIVFSKQREPNRKYHSPVTAFLPHIFQIIQTSKIVNIEKIKINIKDSNSDKIILEGICENNTEIYMESNLASDKKNQYIKIYTDKNTRPSIYVNLAGILGENSFIKYPSIRYFDSTYEIKEDIIEKMIIKNISLFSNDKKNSTMQIKNYFKIAKKIVEIEKNRIKKVAVIGGGIFGILSAIEISQKGYEVDIFEKNNDILLEASLVNQCRIHMGYHYPRDKETAIATLSAKDLFCKIFPEAVVEKKFENYYCLAKEDSKVSPKEYIKFCNDVGLPIDTSWPKKINIDKNKIDFCLKVPEKIFDNKEIKRKLYSLIKNNEKIRLLKSSEVVSIKEKNKIYILEYKNRSGKKYSKQYDAIINSTYSNVNNIHKMAGLNMPDYQFELCEMVIITPPWKGKSGIAIMDGPFFGFMPFGFSKEYLMYDVEISVLERTTGKLPKFKRGISYYDNPKNSRKRFTKYINKIKKYLPQVENSRYIKSMYTTRIVLPKREKDDARPTVVSNPAPGFWTIFSGKIATCAPYSKKLACEVDKYFGC